MHNSDVQQMLVACDIDIQGVKTLISGLGATSSITPYLTKYSIIRSCGTIEMAYKTVIADFCCRRVKQQVKNYINLYIRDGSSNPSYDKIIRTLKSFDEAWANDFKHGVDIHPRSQNLRTSLQSLVDARNDFAHGGNPALSIDDILMYFQDSQEIINILDSIVHS